MFKELLFAKLKEYGESVVAKYGESDINMVHGIITNYVDKLSPIKKRVTKTMIRHVKNDIDNYIRDIKYKHSNPKIVDADFTVKEKK